MREHPKEKSHLSTECLPLYLAALLSVNVFLIQTQALVPPPPTAADSKQRLVCAKYQYKYQSATNHQHCVWMIRVACPLIGIRCSFDKSYLYEISLISDHVLTHLGGCVHNIPYIVIFCNSS